MGSVAGAKSARPRLRPEACKHLFRGSGGTTGRQSSRTTAASARPGMINAAPRLTVSARAVSFTQPNTLPMRTAMLLLPFALFACSSPTPPEANAPARDSLPTGDNSRNALDWAGTYRGTLPCADCEGIATRIALNADGTYRHEATHLGKSKDPIVTEGAFSWESDGGRIVLTGLEGMHRYRVGEEVLIMLDAEGNAITGELAERYRLPREAKAPGNIPTSLEGPRWVLVELMGTAVDAKSNPKEAFITFDAKEKRATGNAGCNSFFGGYSSDANGRLRFDKLGMTMMACMDPNREAEFTKALEQVDNYTLADSTLSLNKARMAPLMRLRAR